MKTYKTVDEYISQSVKEVQSKLLELRKVIKEAAPKAVERISYGMPFYEYGGSGFQGRLIYFAAFKKHISIFIAPRFFKTIPIEFKKYHVANATYKFPLDKPLPLALIKKTVKTLVKEKKVDQKNSGK